jgi:signal transduction histidine kinase
VVPPTRSAIASSLGDLTATDLANFNRWLCVTRLRATTGIGAFAGTVTAFGIGSINVGAVAATCLGLALVSALGLATRVTVGIIAAANGSEAVVFCFIFAIVVVPMGLVSTRSGVLAIVVATACHLVVIGTEFGFDAHVFGSIEALGLPVVLALVVQQCRFYGDHLARKNFALADFAVRLEENQHALESQVRTSRALFDVARTLASATNAAELLSRLNTTVATQLGASWASTFEIDDGRGVFRLVATTNTDTPLEDLRRLELPTSGWPAVDLLRSSDVLALTGHDAQRVPVVLTGGRRHGAVLLAGLQADTLLTGFLAVGFDDLGDVDRERSVEFLRGMAQHASLVLRNARLLEEVRLASEMKSEFVGAISHELRSPLNVTLGYLEMLQDGALGPLAGEQCDALETIRHESIALLEMITALLDLNRLEAGRLPVARENVDLERLFGEICARLPAEWRRAEVTITVDVAPNVPILRTDPGKLKTIVRNLLHNSLKFTDRGWISLAATLSPGGDVVISVRDTGCGIPAEALGYIFDMFRQVPGTGGGGVGLGLHLVWRLVTVLGGSVDVASAEQRGTEFVVTLPREQTLPLDAAPNKAA